MTDDKGAGKGHKDFKGFCVYHGNWWSDVKPPDHYRCPECKIEAKNEERDGPYKIGDVFYQTEIYSERDAIIANSAYVAGRKAERERCLRILRSHQGKCEEILLTDYLETPF